MLSFSQVQLQYLKTFIKQVFFNKYTKGSHRVFLYYTAVEALLFNVKKSTKNLSGFTDSCNIAFALS